VITDHVDPHDLLKTLVAHGVVVTPVDGRPDLYTATCPFDDHPAVVDTIAEHRDRVAAWALSAALADEVADGWRDREEWRPAFNIRPLHGVFHCFGCGEHGTAEALTARLARLTTSGEQR
jgi:hypothetical protein